MLIKSMTQCGYLQFFSQVCSV